jgi:hypothetical protein
MSDAEQAPIVATNIVAESTVSAETVELAAAGDQVVDPVPVKKRAAPVDNETSDEPKRRKTTTTTTG